jgi:hypothetical protein
VLFVDQVDGSVYLEAIMGVRHRLLYVALCTALHFGACSAVLAAPAREAAQTRDEQVKDTSAVHACPHSGAKIAHRPVGLDGRRIRPVD